jgi:NAD(P)-dependent dehydrogenase (short-subunit alcohol dehydrogenase family)
MLQRLAAAESSYDTVRWEAMAAGVPLRRLGTAEEVANFATWLLSDEANYITGDAFLIDGALNA